MIADLNRLIDAVESTLEDEVDVDALARSLGTTEYHLRRMFSSLAGMSFSEYVRRRRMTCAAADVVRGDPLLDVATRYGYGSAEAFGRAFRSVHGASPSEVRRDGGPLRTQPHVRFRLTVEGSSPMDTSIINRSAFRLIGYAARVPLMHHGVNLHIQQHIQAIPPNEHTRLKSLSSAAPHGLLQVTADVDSDAAEGTVLTYLHGVATTVESPAPVGLDAIEVTAGRWAVFRTTGPYPAALQETWAATAAVWFPSNPWRLRPGPSIVAVLDRAEDFSTATTELWLPVEPG